VRLEKLPVIPTATLIQQQQSLLVQASWGRPRVQTQHEPQTKGKESEKQKY